MRVIMEYKPNTRPLAQMRLYIHGAPHYRQHYRVFDVYRAALIDAAKAANVKIPITVPIDLWVLYVDPTSPDIFNLGLALTRAMDGSSKHGILADDSLIAWVSGMGSYYPNRATRADYPFRSRFYKMEGV